MARAAILRDGFLVRRGVAVVVTAETAGIVGMAEIIRISSPGHLEIGEHVASVNREERLAGGLDLGGPLARTSGYFCW